MTVTPEDADLVRRLREFADGLEYNGWHEEADVRGAADAIKRLSAEVDEALRINQLLCDRIAAHEAENARRGQP